MPALRPARGLSAEVLRQSLFHPRAAPRHRLALHVRRPAQNPLVLRRADRFEPRLHKRTVLRHGRRAARPDRPQTDRRSRGDHRPSGSSPRRAKSHRRSMRRKTADRRMSPKSCRTPWPRNGTNTSRNSKRSYGKIEDEIGTESIETDRPPTGQIRGLDHRQGQGQGIENPLRAVRRAIDRAATAGPHRQNSKRQCRS